MRLALLVLLASIACALHAQSFPASGKPVRIVVPFPPGGQTDIQARAIAQKMNQSLKVPVIVDNKPGGSSIIGAREVQRAAPDGQVLLYTFGIHVQLPHLYKTPPWDVFKDFTPVTTGARSATVLTAHISAPFNTVQELVAYAKANPSFTFKAGIVEGRVIDVKSIQQLASLPSREEVLAKVLFLIQASAQRLVTAISGVGRNLAVVVDQGVKEGKFSE